METCLQPPFLQNLERWLHIYVTNGTCIPFPILNDYITQVQVFCYSSSLAVRDVVENRGTLELDVLICQSRKGIKIKFHPDSGWLRNPITYWVHLIKQKAFKLVLQWWRCGGETNNNKRRQRQKAQITVKHGRCWGNSDLSNALRPRDSRSDPKPIESATETAFQGIVDALLKSIKLKKYIYFCP